MADTVTSQTIQDGERLAILKFTNESDGTGESSVKKVDVSALKADSKGRFFNFKIGGTVNISRIQSQLMELKAELLKFNPKIKEGERTGINNFQNFCLNPFF